MYESVINAYVSGLESHHCVLNGLGRAVNFWVYSRNVPPPRTHRHFIYPCDNAHSCLPCSARV